MNDAILRAMMMAANRASAELGYRVCGVVTQRSSHEIWLCALEEGHHGDEHLDRHALAERRATA